MRVFSIQGNRVVELNEPQAHDLPQQTLPTPGYLWVSCSRAELEQSQLPIQAALQNWCSLQLVDLHLADLLNAQLPSRFDYTSQYDLLVFRRLAVGPSQADGHPGNSPLGNEKNQLVRPSCGASTPARSALSCWIGFCSRYIRQSVPCATAMPIVCWSQVATSATRAEHQTADRPARVACRDIRPI
jgi:hypothetical protein